MSEEKCMENALVEQVTVDLSWAGNRRWQPGHRVDNQGAAAVCGLWWVREGYVEVGYMGHNDGVRVGAGEAYLVPQGIGRAYIRSPKGAQWLSVGLTARLFGKDDLMPRLQPPLLWTPDEDEAGILTGLMTTAARYWNEDYRGAVPTIPRPARPDDPLSLFIALSAARALFGVCWERHRPSQAVAKEPVRDLPVWLGQTLQEMARDPSLHLPELIQKAGVSATHFRRIFHRWMQTTPQAYLSRLRIEAARRLLTQTHLPIADIAAEVGLESVPHFTRLFTEVVGLPPARYRRDTRRPRL